MTNPAKQDQSNKKRGADLLERGLWLSSFCFLEITWKTQGEKTSLVIKDKYGRNCLRFVSLVFKQAPFSSTPELISQSPSDKRHVVVLAVLFAIKHHDCQLSLASQP